MSHIFISHSSRDGEQATRLLSWLHANGFSETFLDFDKHAGLAPGSDWERTLYREIAGAEAVILILTKNWFDSKWCFAEFTQARALGKAIYPLIEAPTGETFVSSDIQHLDLLKDREGGLARLAAELTGVALNARGGFPWDHTRPPYPGLLAFDEADAAIYFGRDDDVRRLIERLNARRAQGGARLVAVLGASGSGKSSLLRAGVLPRLKRDTHNWIALPPFRPQLHPLEELAQAVAIALGSSADWRHWREAFAAEDLTRAFSDLARDIRVAHGANEAQILITIDQAEELFGAADRAETEKFVRVVNGLLDERLPFIVAMALRSDYLGQLQQAPALTALFEEFSLKPMPLARVRDIILGPARVAGLTVDDALVTAAVSDAETDDALPLLAFALRELYDRFGQTGRLTAESYKVLGDDGARLSPLENAVRRKADEVLSMAKPTLEDLRALKEAFVPAMVRVNADGEYVRRPARLDVLPSQSRPLIERLARARLLVIRQDRDMASVEVAHEALLRKWPLLRGWLDEEREFLIGKDRIEQDLRDWEKAPAQEKTEALLSGLKLARARTWLQAKPLQLNEAERNFIQASVVQHDAAASRVESRQLAAQSQQDRAAGDLGLALRRGIEAAERWPTEEAEIALRTVLEGPVESLILHHSGSVINDAFSPDGKRIAALSDEQTARVWDAETGHLLVTLTGHADYLVTAAFSPDGKRIVTSGGDETPRVWDIDTGSLLVTLTGHTDLAINAEFSPDGKRIVTASRDHTARVWDAETGHPLVTLADHLNYLNTATFSPDGKRIVTTGGGQAARVWDAETGQLQVTLTGYTAYLIHAAFSPSGERIVTTSAEHIVRVWDANTGHLLGILIGHTLQVVSAVFSPDGKRILTASSDFTARVWDAETGHTLTILTGHTGQVCKAAFSPDGKRIVTASGDRTVRVWDAETGHLLTTLMGHTEQVKNAAFSSDGNRIVTSSDHAVRVWDVEMGHPLATLTGHSGYVNRAAFSPNGRRVVTASEDKTARVWDAATGRLFVTLAGHTDYLSNAVFSPDGKRIVTASWDKTARVWDAEAGHLLVALTGHSEQVNNAVFSPDGKRIVSASGDHTARVWNAETGHLVATLTGHSEQVNNAVFSPDGKCIVTSDEDRTARIWNAETGHLLATLIGHTDYLSNAAFSSDGKRIVSASGDGTARIWDAETGRLLGILTGHTDRVNNAEFSPDGQHIVTASWDHTARVWDAETSHLLATLTGHGGYVNKAVFSPDGKRIVTASGDETARIWDAGTGHLLGTLTGHTGRVRIAAFSPDGRRIVSASTDHTARIYIAGLDELLEWAKKHLPMECGD